MSEAYMPAAPSGAPIDLRHLDGTLMNLRQAERAVGIMTAYLAEARDRIAATPDDPEAARRVRMAGLRLRSDAVALALQLEALVRDEAAP